MTLFRPAADEGQMQQIVGAILILFGLGWLASQLPTTPVEPPLSHETTWRRTCDGWERADWLRGDLLREQPALHPAILGLALMLFALAALVGLPSDAERKEQSQVARISSQSGP
jgi:hypothetical protein